MSVDLLNLDVLPSWDHIDAMVDYDPLRLRDVAWQLRCEVERLRCRVVDRDALEAEATRGEAERQDLAQRCAVLEDHVRLLETDKRASLAIDWDLLRDDIARIHAAGAAGAFPSARVVDELVDAVRKAVS